MEQDRGLNELWYCDQCQIHHKGNDTHIVMLVSGKSMITMGWITWKRILRTMQAI